MNPIIESAALAARETVYNSTFAVAKLAGKSTGAADEIAWDAAGAAYDAVCEAAEPVAIQGGVHRCGEGSSVVWAVYDRAAVEAYLGTACDSREAVEELTGWHSFYSGAGRGFGHDPYVKVYGRKIIVKQFRGLDI